ncbi:hypothetical protein BCR35DRAFT_305160 [Leucosporidium creatinivorum]|uniref:Uncharacterized protein n=1 Tax=Leucosporidium creatinivorum TaxID=106004 RepID=A0A1Y2F2B0_9BASI|nr:hypothetical protein BCR35DRAFT_305160 [Leucosporidium creatinivorum]
MPIFISDPYSYASPGTPPKDVFFFVAYRTSEDALQAQRANEGKGLPSLNASGSLPLSVVTSGPADRIGDLTNSLRWEHVWPVAQRSYLAYGIIPPFEGVPPTPEKGVVVSERYQAEARKVKEEMRVAELARMREGGMAPVQVQGQGRGGRGRGADGEGGGGKQQKKQERKKRLRENARARGNGGQQQAASSNGGGAGGHQHYNDPPQQQYDQFYSSNHHDGEREHFSGAEVGYDAAGGAQDDCDPQGRYDDYQDDDGQEYESEDEPGSLPFAFPFPSAKGREGKRARFS